MAQVLLTTMSDDRSGRKGGVYEKTQKHIETFFRSQPNQFGITRFEPWTWKRLAATDFYKEHKVQLNQTDGAINGRVYKPFIITEGLKLLQEGDFLIYTDCSPELWKMPPGTILPAEFDLQVLRNLCVNNRGILTAYQPWVPNESVEDRGYHTHENFTLEIAMKTMGLTQFRYCLQHASGMIVLQKNALSVEFANNWLKWNCLAQCASVGPFEHGNPNAFWTEEFAKYGKVGHRHDQSISGLLLNEIGHLLIKSPCLNPEWFHPITFLQFCRKGYSYRFISSIKGPTLYKVRNTGSGYALTLRT